MRHIDHIVVAVRDLDRAADVYRSLGFQVGSRNRHPWGTENRIIQFGSSFVELITVGDDARRIEPHQERGFSFGAFVRDYLRNREGIAMLVLSSADAVADAARFAEQGIGGYEPFFFERKAKRPDGAETHVAFTLAFASDCKAPDAGFFVCQQHFPENFWNHSFQQHANSAANIAAVTLTAGDPKWHENFLSRFSGAEKQSLPDGRLLLALDKGRIEVAAPTEAQRQSFALPLFTSFAVRVGEIDAVIRLLKTERIPFTSSKSGVALASSICFGVELRFEM